MAEFKHLVLVEFKPDMDVDQLLKEMERLVAQLDLVKSFVWGKDMESHEMLRQGYTHAFMMTFSSKDDFTAFISHPDHVNFSTTFSAAIVKALLLDFPVVSVKPLVVVDVKPAEVIDVKPEEVADDKPEEVVDVKLPEVVDVKPAAAAAAMVVDIMPAAAAAAMVVDIMPAAVVDVQAPVAVAP